MTKPKPGQKITAAWAAQLLNGGDMQPPPNGVRTSVGPVQATPKSTSPAVTVFVKNIGEDLEPYSLIGVEEPEETAAGPVVLKATKEATSLTVSVGAQKVPADGLFIPVWIEPTPMRVLVDTSETFKVGEECGREADGVKLSPAGTGFICIEAPIEDSEYAYVVGLGGGGGPIWGVNIGKLMGAGHPLTGVSIGLAALLKPVTGNKQTWRFVKLGGPTGGTYTVGIEGDDAIDYIETELDWDATPSEVQTAIRALAGMSTVTVTGSSSVWRIDFTDFDETITVYSYDSFTGGTEPKTTMRKQLGPDLEVTDKRKFFARRDSGSPISDGTLIQIDTVQGIPTLVWADCKATAALRDLEETP